MKNSRKMVNLFAAFIILIGGAFLVLPETSYASSCTATRDCGGGLTCSCTGASCGFTENGCYSRGGGTSSKCECPAPDQQ